MKYCMLCKYFVLDEEWLQHVVAYHDGNKKTPNRFVPNKTVPPMVRKLLDPPQPPLPPGYKDQDDKPNQPDNLQ